MKPRPAQHPAAPPADAEQADELIPFEEFRNGLPHGRFRVIVNPALVGPFVAYQTHSRPLALALIGPGMPAALYGHLMAGALLVGAAVLLRMAVKRQAANILLHLTTRIPGVYLKAVEHGVMEVQRA